MGTRIECGHWLGRLQRRHVPSACIRPLALIPVATLCLLVSGAACAKDNLFDLPLEQLLNVEVTSVSRLAQPLDEAPAAVTVIDRQMIKDSGAWDLAEVFRLVPGMYVAYNTTSVYSVTSTVSYHGLSDNYARRMQVLVDGRSVYSPLFGSVLWNDLPLALDDIERIEVIRGPNSASYGANSFLSIINIITRRAADQQGTAFSASLGRGRSEIGARHGGKSGDLSYRVSTLMRNDAGEDSNIAAPFVSSAARATYDWSKPTPNKSDDKRIRMLTFRADYQLSQVDSLEFQFGYNGGQRQEGIEGENFAPRWKNVDNHFEMLRWARHLDAGNELSVQFYHSYEGATDKVQSNATGSPVFFDGDALAQRFDLEAQHIFVPAENMRLLWGGSLRSDRTYWPQGLNTNDTMKFSLARLFGNLEWRIRPDLLINAGAMVERNDFTGTDATPRIAVNWHLTPMHTLRASYSKATRTPVVLEEKADYRYRFPSLLPKKYPAYIDYIVWKALGNLRPERTTSSELGYVGKTAMFDIDFRLFHDKLSDLITYYPYDPCPPGAVPLVSPNVICNSKSTRTFHNAGVAVLQGLEGQLQWHLHEHTRLVYGFSHTRVSSKDEDGATFSQSVPANSQSLMLTHRFAAGWNLSLMGYQVSKTHMVGSGSGSNGEDYFVDGNRRFDARLAYRFQPAGHNAELALTVQNLTNARYVELNRNNEVPGRTVWLNLKFEL